MSYPSIRPTEIHPIIKWVYLCEGTLLPAGITIRGQCSSEITSSCGQESEWWRPSEFWHDRQHGTGTSWLLKLMDWSRLVMRFLVMSMLHCRMRCRTGAGILMGQATGFEWTLSGDVLKVGVRSNFQRRIILRRKHSDRIRKSTATSGLNSNPLQLQLPVTVHMGETTFSFSTFSWNKECL